MRITEIQQNVKFYTINTEKFKTNILSIFLTTPLDRKTVTYNSLVSAVLRRGTNRLTTQEEISKTLEEMYGADFDCGVEKIGDNQVLKFYIESINDNYLPVKENILQKTTELLIDIVFNPLVENNAFKAEYVEAEKQNIKQIIENKIEDKAEYALNRCIEEMHKDKPYSLYKYGYVEDLESINSQNLYEHYKTLIANCKIDIFISGNIDDKIIDTMKNNGHLKELQPRQIEVVSEINHDMTSTKEIADKMNVTQGKLVLGLDVDRKNDASKYACVVYNAILRRNSSLEIISKCKRKSKSCIYCAIKVCKTKG